jgi:predicted nucleic acid-binding protein
VIFADTNLVSETVKPQTHPRVAAWIRQHDAELAISTIVLAEIAYGIARVRPLERAKRLEGFVAETRRHFAGRIYPFDENAALVYGEIMGGAALAGKPLSVPYGMIAAIAIARKAPLATRNTADFSFLKIGLVNPWESGD